MVPSFICFDKPENRCRMVDKQDSHRRMTTSSDGIGTVSKKVQKVRKLHHRYENDQDKDLSKTAPKRDYAILPPQLTSELKYNEYPMMYARERVNSSPLAETEKRPLMSLFDSECIRQRVVIKNANKKSEKKICKNEGVLVKPDTQDVCTSSNPYKRIRRSVVTKHISRTIKRLERYLKKKKAMMKKREIKYSVKAVQTVQFFPKPSRHTIGMITSRSNIPISTAGSKLLRNRKMQAVQTEFIPVVSVPDLPKTEVEMEDAATECDIEAVREPFVLPDELKYVIRALPVLSGLIVMSLFLLR